MNEFFGWVQGSDMPSVYVHLSGRDVDKALLKTYGITPDSKENEGSKFKPKACPGCEAQNAPTNRFCCRCGKVLDEKTTREIIKESLDRKEVDEVMDSLIHDEEFRAVFKRKLDEIRKDRRE